MTKPLYRCEGTYQVKDPKLFPAMINDHTDQVHDNVNVNDKMTKDDQMTKEDKNWVLYLEPFPVIIPESIVVHAVGPSYKNMMMMKIMIMMMMMMFIETIVEHSIGPP